MAEFRPHHRVTRAAAGQLNEMAATVENLTKLGAGQFGADGVQPDLDQIYPLVRITKRQLVTGTLWAYSGQVVQVRAIDAHYGPLHDDLPTFEFGPEITTLYEESNNPYVPVDGSAIVRVEPGADASWRFKWDDTIVFGEITAREGTRHAWRQQVPIHNDWMDLTYPVGKSGTVDLNYARGLMGEKIPVGTRVVLYRGHCSGYPYVLIEPVIDGDGNIVNESQSLKIIRAAGGTFNLLFSGGASPQLALDIPYNVSASGLKARLQAVPGVGLVNVLGSGTAASPYYITFLDDFDDIPPLQADPTNLKSDQEWLFAGSAGEFKFWAYQTRCEDGNLGRWRQRITIKTSLEESIVGPWELDEDFCVPCGCSESSESSSSEIEESSSSSSDELWYCIDCGSSGSGSDVSGSNDYPSGSSSSGSGSSDDAAPKWYCWSPACTGQVLWRWNGETWQIEEENCTGPYCGASNPPVGPPAEGGPSYVVTLCNSTVRICRQLTYLQVNAITNQTGPQYPLGTISGGPYDTQVECEIACPSKPWYCIECESSSSDNIERVVNICCPNGVPVTLYLRGIFSGPGCGIGAIGPIELNYDESVGGWVAITSDCQDGSNMPAVFYLLCTGETLTFRMGVGDCGLGHGFNYGDTVEFECEPFFLTTTNLPDTCSCWLGILPGECTYQFTVTED